MRTQKIFIVGLDDFNKAKLERLPQAEGCEFLPALTFDEMRGAGDYDIGALIERASENMSRADGGPDGVASYFDFPGTLLVPILAQHFGLPGPSLESVLKCENKYWSRLEQQKVVPEHIPQFRAFSPDGDHVFAELGLLPPFWIKPIKSFRSFLAFHINDDRQFSDVLRICREKGGALAEPFHEIMERAEVPSEILDMPETFIAESPIGGWQCTLEGYAHGGRVSVYGVVDSIREQDSSSFSRYEYPSSLPLEIQHRMMDVTRSVLQQIGYDNAAFNAEFFYDQTSDQVWLLEINPRMSQSHADMFEKVHGVSHHGVMIDLALGRKPRPMERGGDFNIAGNFMFRTFDSGRIQRIPSAEALDRLRQRQPKTEVLIPVEPGQHLKDLKNQDMYSFELANVLIGGRDQADMLDKYDEALAVLQFDIEKDTEAVIH